MLSKRAANLKTSPTLALVAKAKELQAQGHDVISLTVGEPDWPTFEIPSKAGIEAIQKNVTKYTAASGTVELRQAIAGKLKTEIGLDYGVNQIMVGPGAKFVIFSALQMICDPGDEVILSAPYWVSYPTMIELAGGVPQVVECDASTNYLLTAEALEKAITPRTKALLYCSPSNPTGTMYSREDLQKIAEVLRRHPQVVVLSDDMYNRLVFTGGQVAPQLLHVAPDLKERVVAINGGSKAYSMTGWRIGWAAGPAALIKAMGDYQSQATGAPSSIAQYAAREAILKCEPDIARALELLIRRREKGLEALGQIPGFITTKPQGAFYFWVNIQGALKGRYEGREIRTDKDFCDVLLEKFHVATVPGIECGTPGYMRLSFATTEELMAKACERMADLVSKIR